MKDEKKELLVELPMIVGKLSDDHRFWRTLHHCARAAEKGQSISEHYLTHLSKEIKRMSPLKDKWWYENTAECDIDSFSGMEKAVENVFGALTNSEGIDSVPAELGYSGSSLFAKREQVLNESYKYALEIMKALISLWKARSWHC